MACVEVDVFGCECRLCQLGGCMLLGYVGDR